VPSSECANSASTLAGALPAVVSIPPAAKFVTALVHETVTSQNGQADSARHVIKRILNFTDML